MERRPKGTRNIVCCENCMEVMFKHNEVDTNMVVSAPDLLDVAKRWAALRTGPHALLVATDEAIAKAEGRT